MREGDAVRAGGTKGLNGRRNRTQAHRPLSSTSPEHLPRTSPGRRRAVLVAMCLALTIVMSNVAMLNVALPDIAAHFEASQSEQLWIVDAYVVILAALLLPFGALGDRYGRRTAVLVGTVLFGCAAAFAATADSSGVLVGCRAAAGIGAALIMPGTLATITSVFPPEDRARAVGVWAGFAGAGGLLGILIAGAVLEHFYWGGVFVVTAGFSIVAFTMTAVAAPNTADRANAHTDLPGSALSLVGIGAVIFGVIEGPQRGWTSPLTAGAIVLGLACLALFIRWELRTSRPLLDPRLFRDRAFATGTAALALLFLAMIGLFLVILQYLQLILRYDTFKAALSILPVAITMLPLAAVAGTLSDRYGQRKIGSLGLLASAGSFAYLATLSSSSTYWQLLPGMLATGAGVALAMTPATNAIVTSLPSHKQGVASAVNDTAREIGAAFGIAVLGTAFNAGYRQSIADTAAALPGELGTIVRSSPGAGYAVSSRLGPDAAPLAQAVADSFIVGMRWSMAIASGLLFLCATYVFWKAPTAAAERIPSPIEGAARKQ